MFWACQKLSDYWTFLFKTLNEAFSLDIKPSVEVAIFGVPELGVSLTNRVQFVIAIATLLARRRIVLEWKSTNPPKASMWLCDVVSVRGQVEYRVRGHPLQGGHLNLNCVKPSVIFINYIQIF